ncbi:MAG: hypothetical protein ACKV2U_22660 [Bryobacteraceae bacterium]
MTEHYLNSLRTHDITLPNRAADIPGEWLEQVAKGWEEFDAESRDIAVSTAAKMRGRSAGKFLLSVAALTGEESSTTAAEALLLHPDCPDGNTLLAAAQPIKDPMTRFHLYRAAGAHGAAVNIFEPIAAKETNVDARQAALEAMARLGHLPSLHTLYERVEKATAAEVTVLHDALIYVGDRRLATALIPWLHKTDPVSRMGSDRSPAMVRQCDYALWTAHLLSIGVTLPANRIDNYSPATLAAAKPVLLALPDLPVA